MSPTPDALEELAQAAKALDQVTAYRDGLIRRAAKAGIPHRQIAGAVNLSHPTIRRIVNTPAKEQS